MLVEAVLWTIEKQNRNYLNALVQTSWCIF